MPARIPDREPAIKLLMDVEATPMNTTTVFPQNSDNIASYNQPYDRQWENNFRRQSSFQVFVRGCKVFLGNLMKNCKNGNGNDSRRTDLTEYGVRLYTAAMSGDWKTAEKIHAAHSNCFIERITKGGETALHIAALANKTRFVAALLPIMRRTDSLALQDHSGNTALCYAATSGSVDIARALVEADPRLTRIRNAKQQTPLHMAALFGHRDMFIYLHRRHTPDDNLLNKDHADIFLSIINADLFDIALGILGGNPFLATVRDDKTNETPLHVLAKKSHKSCGNTRGCWSSCCSCCCCCIGKEKNALNTKIELVKCLWEIVLQQNTDVQSSLRTTPLRLLFVAVRAGNVEFVITLINRYPDMIWKLDDGDRTIFHVAVEFRQAAIFRLIFEIGAIKDLLVTFVNDETKDSILHLAAMLPSSDRLNCISGAALQMQREMLWFEVVENLLQPQLREMMNKNGETAKALFTEQHKELRKEGEEWLRKTAGSCSVVATLIAGVVFAAALKIPEIKGAWHWVFIICDSMSLIFSTASILMFLSIMTSRYAEKDFLKSLPQKLFVGLTLLFLSIATMMAAFTVNIHIVFKDCFLWILIGAFACIIICIFVWLEFPLLMKVYHSTFGCSTIFKPRGQLFPSPSRNDLTTVFRSCFVLESV